MTNTAATAVRFTKTDAETYKSTDGRFIIRAAVRVRYHKGNKSRKVTGWILRDNEADKTYPAMALRDAKVWADGVAQA